MMGGYVLEWACKKPGLACKRVLASERGEVNHHYCAEREV